MNGPSAAPTEVPPAVSLCACPLVTMTKRADFLACARARKAPGGAFLLQARDRRDDETTARVGITASKKIGNAVARNRAKRRLRALAREVIGAHGKPSWDYVLVARPGATLTAEFDEMRRALTKALSRVHETRDDRPSSR